MLSVRLYSFLRCLVLILFARPWLTAQGFLLTSVNPGIGTGLSQTMTFYFYAPKAWVALRFPSEH